MNSQNETQKDNMNPNSKEKLKEQQAVIDKLRADKQTEDERKQRDSSTFYFTEISPIQIYIRSNIPGKEPWLLKRSNFITKPERPKSAEKIAKYSDLPFFTNEVLYPTKDLFKLEPYQIFDFFFDRRTFERILNKIIFLDKKTIVSSEDSDKRRPEYNEQNVMTMLQLLFTTVYPRTNNVTNSVNEFLYKRANPLDLNRIMSKPAYTYMKIGGQEYTVMKVVWLNDIFNHPRYFELADKFIDYKYWCITQSKSIQKKIDDNMTKIENLVRRHDFGELLSLLEQRASSYKDISRSYTFEQEVFKSNIFTFSKIIKLLDLYKRFKNGNITRSEFLMDTIKNKISFQPAVGLEVEINLDSFASTNKANNFWYYGKIVEKTRDEQTNDTYKNPELYKVEIYYRERENLMKRNSIYVFVKKDSLREPILPKILEKEGQYPNVTIEYLTDKGDGNKGISFGKNEQTNDYKNMQNSNIKAIELKSKTFYNNINNLLTGNARDRNKGIFDANKRDLRTYNENKQFYRYKIPPNDENNILQKLYNDQLAKENPRDVFLSYLDMLEETYNKVKTSMNFNSRIKTFIDGVIRYHKIILPIKTINEMYLKRFKIDIQHKDISTGETAMELTPYKEFVNFMADFVTPKMESSNPDLQSFVLAYAENIAGENFISLMDLLETCYSENKPKCKHIKNEQSKEAIIQYVSTSVNYVNMMNKSAPQYEIYVHLNFVKGHMDNSNWAGIKCNYNDALLTRKFEGIVGMQERVGDWMVEPAPFVGVDGSIPEEEGETAPVEAKAVPVSKTKQAKGAIPIAEAVPVTPTPPKRLTKKSRGGQRQRKKRRTRRYSTL